MADQNLGYTIASNPLMADNPLYGGPSKVPSSKRVRIDLLNADPSSAAITEFNSRLEYNIARPSWMNQQDFASLLFRGQKKIDEINMAAQEVPTEEGNTMEQNADSLANIVETQLGSRPQFDQAGYDRRLGRAYSPYPERPRASFDNVDPLSQNYIIGQALAGLITGGFSTLGDSAMTASMALGQAQATLDDQYQQALANDSLQRRLALESAATMVSSYKQDSDTYASIAQRYLQETGLNMRNAEDNAALLRKAEIDSGTKIQNAQLTSSINVQKGLLRLLEDVPDEETARPILNTLAAMNPEAYGQIASQPWSPTSKALLRQAQADLTGAKAVTENKLRDAKYNRLLSQINVDKAKQYSLTEGVKMGYQRLDIDTKRLNVYAQSVANQAMLGSERVNVQWEKLNLDREKLGHQIAAKDAADALKNIKTELDSNVKLEKDARTAIDKYQARLQTLVGYGYKRVTSPTSEPKYTDEELAEIEVVQQKLKDAKSRYAEITTAIDGIKQKVSRALGREGDQGVKSVAELYTLLDDFSKAATQDAGQGSKDDGNPNR